jgi:hypothetical protein
MCNRRDSLAKGIGPLELERPKRFVSRRHARPRARSAQHSRRGRNRPVNGLGAQRRWRTRCGSARGDARSLQAARRADQPGAQGLPGRSIWAGSSASIRLRSGAAWPRPWPQSSPIMGCRSCRRRRPPLRVPHRRRHGRESASSISALRRSGHAATGRPGRRC